LEDKVTELLQANGLVSHPRVNVYIKERRSRPIMVVGAVGRPLVYQAIRPTTLLEVLTEAGGIANDAGSTVIVTRAASPGAAGDPDGSDGNGSAETAAPKTITVNINDLLESGDPKYNIPLLGGDIVTVPRAGIVYVVGGVERQGGFVLQNDHEDMTTLRVLALAGGLKGTAKPRQATILRKNPDTGQRQELALDVTKIMERKSEDVRLLPNDILFIPDSTGKRALRRSAEVALGLASGIALFRLSR
jgi:polysaccharide export outer membrane protein